MPDDELEEIRRRRVQELQARQHAGIEEQVAQQQAAAEQEAAKETLLRQILTPEARERLARLKLARPEETRSVENQLISLAQSGRLQQKIDDEQLKMILVRLNPNPRDIKIRRK